MEQLPAILLGLTTAGAAYAGILKKGEQEAKAAWREHLRRAYAAWIEAVTGAMAAYQAYLLEDSLWRDARENPHAQDQYISKQATKCHALLGAASAARSKAIAAKFVVSSSESNAELFEAVDEVMDMVLPAAVRDTQYVETTAEVAEKICTDYGHQVDMCGAKLRRIERLFFDVRHLRP